MQKTPVLIIGAGPAGLAIAGRLRRFNIPFEVLEKSEQVAAAWHQHYDRLHLHTIKELSHLPHMPFPADYPRYVPRKQLADYYEKYAATFGIQPHFGEEVVGIKKSREGWQVKTRAGTKWEAQHLVIATGVNRVINRPVFEGEEKFQGRVIHSRIYKNADAFHNQRVLVVGMGNTGAEIALELCENGVETFLSVRSPVNIVPRDTFAGPTQLTALRLARLPVWLGDFLGILLRRLMVGDLSRYGLPAPAMPPAQQLRTTGKTPVIDIGTIQQIKAGKIRVLPGIDHFTKDGVVFVNGARHSFDVVILATGYQAKIEEFLPEITPALDQYRLPRHCIGEGEWEGLYFLGFDNYVPGGILGVIYRDSEKIAAAIQKHLIPDTTVITAKEQLNPFAK